MMEDTTRTQPLRTTPGPRPAGETRRVRLTRTVVFALAIGLGIATWVILAGRDGSSLPNASRIYSPTGHFPSEPNTDTRVSVSWTAVPGAAGYWWAMVEDPARLPPPAIRPSGNDRRVFFRFQGRGYFVLRTAHRVDGRLKWSDDRLYGPIIVSAPGTQDADPGQSPGPGEAAGAATSGAATRDGAGGSGSPGAGRSSAPTPTPDPRFAGEPGGRGTGSGGSGTAGEPGQPAQQPGGGSGPGSNGMSGGRPGDPGPDGPPGR